MLRVTPVILANLLFALIIVLGALLLPRPGHAQSGSFPIIDAEGAQYNPHVAYNAHTEQFLIAWTDYDIHGQLLDRDGGAVGETMPLDISSERQSSPMVTAKTGTSSYFVAWQNISTAGTDTDILGQIVDAGGPRLQAPIAVSERPGRQANPAAAYCDQEDSLLTAWSEDEDAVAPWFFSIFGQRVSGDGDLVGETAPLTVGGFQQIDVDLVFNPWRNEYLAVFRDARYHDNGVGNNDDIFGQRVSCGGSPLLEEEIPISLQYSEPPGGNLQEDPSVALGGGGNQYLVVWEDDRNDPDRGEGPILADVYGQFLDGDGALIRSDAMTNFPISVAEGNQEEVVVAYSPLGDAYLVVWEDSRGADTDIYGQFVLGNGALLGSEIPIHVGPGNQNQPSMTYSDATESFLVVWSDERPEAVGAADLYGQSIGSVRRLFIPVAHR